MDYLYVFALGLLRQEFMLSDRSIVTKVRWILSYATQQCPFSINGHEDCVT